MKYLQWFAWAVNLPLQGILLHSLFRGDLRSFPFLFLYSLALFLWTVANIAAREAGRLPVNWQWTYWLVELALQCLLYGMVMSMVWRSQRGNPNRVRIMRILLVVIGLAWLVTLGITQHPRRNQWMTDFTKYVAFGGMLLNLALWAVLVGRRHADRSLLMISGGYGIQSAGEAISQSLRMLAMSNRSLPILITGNLIAVLTHSMCLLIWWRAVVRENSERSAETLTGVCGEE